jgi:hypothetical protein
MHLTLKYKQWRFCYHEATWSYPCLCVDGKNTKWCCQGWSKWKFQNGEGLMVGSNEEKVEFGWTMFEWRLLKQVKM